MGDWFQEKGIKPMLIGSEGEAFDSPDYLYELKLDGERCVAYLDASGTDLRNKRNLKMLPKVPELSEIHTQVKCRCILDGELAVIHDGKPDFFLIQRRSMMSNPVKIQLEAQRHPACFTAFDILYYEDHPVTDLPLMERKKLLESVIKEESPRFAVSRWIEGQGVAFYDLAKTQNLEGIVAKRKDSRYYCDKRTKEWIKCKFLKDSDYVVCGYIPKENHVTSLALGQYRGGQLVYKGHVILEEQSPSNMVDEPVQANPIEPVYIPSVARSVSALMVQLARLFQEQDQQRDRNHHQKIDRKQRREIDEKKQAMGIRD